MLSAFGLHKTVSLYEYQILRENRNVAAKMKSLLRHDTSLIVSASATSRKLISKQSPVLIEVQNLVSTR